MTETMKIAAAAYPLDWFQSFQDYADKIRQWVAEGAGQGAQMLVFPEYGAMELASLAGTTVSRDLEGALGEVARHRPAADALHVALAAEFGVFILGATGPVYTGARPVNRATLYGPQGLVGHQDKQIMTRFERDTWAVAAGADGLGVLDTRLGQIGVITCYDSEFPLLARAMVEQGAEILLAPSCTETLAGYWRVRVGSMARALENQCVVVHAPLIGSAPDIVGVEDNTGAAAIYGPPDAGWPPTGVLAEGGLNEPGWVYADVSRKLIAQTRADGVVLNMAHWGEQHTRLSQPVRRIAVS